MSFLPEILIALVIVYGTQFVKARYNKNIKKILDKRPVADDTIEDVLNMLAKYSYASGHKIVNRNAEHPLTTIRYMLNKYRFYPNQLMAISDGVNTFRKTIKPTNPQKKYIRDIHRLIYNAYNQYKQLDRWLTKGILLNRRF